MIHTTSGGLCCAGLFASLPQLECLISGNIVDFGALVSTQARAAQPIMSIIPSFSPVFPRHAIERCAASVSFTPPLPDKAFEKVATAATARLTGQGLIAQTVAALAFRMTPDGSVAPVPPSGSGPRLFSAPDQSTTLQLMPDQIVWATQTYVRWQPFVGALERFVFPTLSEILEIVSIAGVRLEYWDRFIWSGTWADFDVRQLLRPQSDYLAAAAIDQPRQWHSHSGWFSPEGQLRRLTNVNVDVVDVMQDPALLGRPSVGIYSSLTDQPNILDYGTTAAEALNEGFVIERLENQHLALKGILGHIITDEMASRIELNARKAK